MSDEPTDNDIELTPYQLRRQKTKRSNSRSGKFPPEVAKARNSERTRRSVEARRRASLILAERYPEEYAELARIEREGIDREKCPLPGDSETERLP